MFSGVVKSYLGIESRIRTKANILENVNVQNALVKIQSKRESKMNKKEVRTYRHLLN